MVKRGRLNLGIILGISTIIMHFLAYFGWSEHIYTIYGNYIYPLIRYVYDFTFGYLPFPSVYIVVIFLFWVAIKSIKSIIVWIRQGFSAKTIQDNFFHCLHFVGCAYFLFYFLWAFNYYRPSFTEVYKLNEVDIDTSLIHKELYNTTLKVNELRISIQSDTFPHESAMEWSSLESVIRENQTFVLQSLGFNTPGRVRIRKLKPNGTLLILSTAGVYIPFVCEGHIDGGLHRLQWPFTLAHEMAHGYGFTDEGECNFLGFLTCIKSNEKWIQYSGYLSYWKYLYAHTKNEQNDVASAAYNQLHTGVKSDLKSIRSEMDKYPDVMPEIRDFIYDLYLKKHGVEDGLGSYDGIIELTIRWKNSGHSL